MSNFIGRPVGISLLGLALAACGGGGTDDTAAPPAQDNAVAPSAAAPAPSAKPQFEPPCTAPDPAVVEQIQQALTAGTTNEAVAVPSAELPTLTYYAVRVADTGAAREGNGWTLFGLHEGKVYVADGLSRRAAPDLPDIMDLPDDPGPYEEASRQALDCLKELVD